MQGELVLDSHTSTIQARTLEKRLPLPLKYASPGRVYRNEAVDSTSTLMADYFGRLSLTQAALPSGSIRGLREVTSVDMPRREAHFFIRVRPGKYRGAVKWMPAHVAVAGRAGHRLELGQAEHGAMLEIEAHHETEQGCIVTLAMNELLDQYDATWAQARLGLEQQLFRRLPSNHVKDVIDQDDIESFGNVGERAAANGGVRLLTQPLTRVIVHHLGRIDGERLQTRIEPA